MRITKEQLKITTVDCICNKCGRSLGDSFGNFLGIPDCTYTGSFYSYKLEDNKGYNFSLCESCLSDLFDTFIIPVLSTGGYVRQSDDQNKINQIYQTCTKSDLTSFLVDENEIVRKYAEVKFKELS